MSTRMTSPSMPSSAPFADHVEAVGHVGGHPLHHVFNRAGSCFAWVSMTAREVSTPGIPLGAAGKPRALPQACEGRGRWRCTGPCHLQLLPERFRSLRTDGGFIFKRVPSRPRRFHRRSSVGERFGGDDGFHFRWLLKEGRDALQPVGLDAAREVEDVQAVARGLCESTASCVAMRAVTCLATRRGCISVRPSMSSLHPSLSSQRGRR